MTTLVSVPSDLWSDILRVLDARRFISDGEDEDNDYEVLDVLDRAEKVDVTGTELGLVAGWISEEA